VKKLSTEENGAKLRSLIVPLWPENEVRSPAPFER